MKEYTYISPQINWLSKDEIFQTVTKDDDIWEIYIKVPFFLNNNVARIIFE